MTERGAGEMTLTEESINRLIMRAEEQGAMRAGVQDHARVLLDRMEKLSDEMREWREQQARESEQLRASAERISKHSARLDALEDLVGTAGLEDLAGIRKWILRLGMVTLVLLGAVATGLVFLAPTLGKLLLGAKS